VERATVQKTVFRLSALDGEDQEAEEAQPRPSSARRSQSLVISSLKRPETRDSIFFQKASRDKTQTRGLLDRGSLGSLGGIEEHSEPSSELSQVSLQVARGKISSG